MSSNQTPSFTSTLQTAKQLPKEQQAQLARALVPTHGSNGRKKGDRRQKKGDIMQASKGVQRLPQPIMADGLKIQVISGTINQIQDYITRGKRPVKNFASLVSFAFTDNGMISMAYIENYEMLAGRTVQDHYIQEIYKVSANMVQGLTLIWVNLTATFGDGLYIATLTGVVDELMQASSTYKACRLLSLLGFDRKTNGVYGGSGRSIGLFSPEGLRTTFAWNAKYNTHAFLKKPGSAKALSRMAIVNKTLVQGMVNETAIYAINSDQINAYLNRQEGVNTEWSEHNLERGRFLDVETIDQATQRREIIITAEIDGATSFITASLKTQEHRPVIHFSNEKQIKSEHGALYKVMADQQTIAFNGTKDNTMSFVGMEMISDDLKRVIGISAASV